MKIVVEGLTCVECSGFIPLLVDLETGIGTCENCGALIVMEIGDLKLGAKGVSRNE